MTFLGTHSRSTRRPVSLAPTRLYRSNPVASGSSRCRLHHNARGIALLEKDRGNPRKSLPKNMAPNKEAISISQALDNDASKEHGHQIESWKCPIPSFSGSPANFSFLSIALPTSSASTVNVTKMERREKLQRSSSAPVLTSRERAFMDSPQLKRKGLAKGRSESPSDSTVSREVTDCLETDKQDLSWSEKTEPMRRASSLKTGKSPPGTPGRRKIVRFADVFGLDLADVRTFFDEVPNVPRSAYRDLKDAQLNDRESDSGSSGTGQLSFYGGQGQVSVIRSSVSGTASTTSLVPLFRQPGCFPNFFDLLRDRKVCLEDAFMVDSYSLKGTIRVQNIGFHKRVALRYTINDWASHTDMEAQYMQGSCDGFSDKFTFHLMTGPLKVGQRVQFCIKYTVCGTDFWDNNVGKNYVFQCFNVSSDSSATIATTTPSASSSMSSSSSSSPSFEYGTQWPKETVPVPINSQQQHTFSGFYSHSPSAISEEPWLRYL